MNVYFVYIDWTCEEIPRPFYVGKGLLKRIGTKYRNKRHANVSMKYGVRREAIFATRDEAAAFDIEIKTIRDLRTFVGDPAWNGVGCNFTMGGDGASGSTHVVCDQTRALMSRKMTGNRNAVGRCRTSDERRKISEALRGHSVSMDTRAKISAKLTGVKLPRARVERAAVGHRGKGKPVEQLTLDGTVIDVYPSAKVAEDTTGVSRSKICLCCKGRIKHAGGFLWRYYARSNTAA